MTILLGQVVLRQNKNIIRELKKQVPGMGYSIAEKLNIMNGCLETIKTTELTGKQSTNLYKVFKQYKGLTDHKYKVHRKIYANLRRIDNAYRYLRFLKGYPVSQRTRSNAKTAARRVNKIGGKKGFSGGKTKQKGSKKKKGKQAFKITAQNKKVMAQLKKLQAKHEKDAKKLLWKNKPKQK